MSPHLTIDESCRAPVRDPARARRDVLPDGRADQRVKELKRPGRREDLRRRQPIGGQLGNYRIKLGQPRRERDLGARAEQRDRARQRDRLQAIGPIAAAATDVGTPSL